MRKLLVTVAVLAVLLLAVDHGSAAYAEHRVSRELRSTLELTNDPEVRVNGFPFLTQAARGRYGSIEVRAADVPVPGFGDVTAEAVLRDVDAPTGDVLAGDPSVLAGEVEARVRIAATDLGRYLDVPDLQVSVPDPAADGAPVTGVELTGTVEIGPVTTLVTVRADVSLQEGQVVLTATDLTAGDVSGLDDALQSVLGRLSARVDPSALPFGIAPTGVRVEGSDIVVTGRGTDVQVVGGS